MSRYICFSQNGRFDVSFEELFSKVQNPGGFFRKKRFLGSIFGFFSFSVAIFGPICMKFIYSEWEANKVVDLFLRVLLDFFSVGAKKIQLKVCDLHLMHMHIFDI